MSGRLSFSDMRSGWDTPGANPTPRRYRVLGVLLWPVHQWLFPHWLYRGPRWWRSLNAWWLGVYGWTFSGDE